MWSATLRDSTSFRETLDKRPKTLIILLKKFYNDLASFLTAAAKNQKSLSSMVTHTKRDMKERITDLETLLTESTHPRWFEALDTVVNIR